MKKSRYRTARRLLIFWTLFIGIGALAGSIGMLTDPSGRAMGMAEMLPYFRVLPFSDILFKDLTFSGIALLIVNGITNLASAVLLLKNKKAGVVLGGVFGITLMLWICIQFYIFPFNFMSTAYFIFGFCQAATGYAAWVFRKQESFAAEIDHSDIDGNIGSNKKRLVVFFSRMGYVKNIAYREAARCGADIYEIKSTERTEGTLGFWWCGRFAMHRWNMPIVPVDIDLCSYEHVTICSPIWVFSLCAAVRSFCAEASGKIREADYILVHHTGGAYKNAAEEMDGLLKLEHTGLRSIRCCMGKYREVYNSSAKAASRRP